MSINRSLPANNSDAGLDYPGCEPLDARCKRLLFQSWHRGTRENDFLLGSFAEISLSGFDSTQLDRFEALLGCTDPDLFDWIIRGGAPPQQHDHDVIRLLRNFWARPTRAPKHHG